MAESDSSSARAVDNARFLNCAPLVFPALLGRMDLETRGRFNKVPHLLAPGQSLALNS
jgi:hypothetical protein